MEAFYSSVPVKNDSNLVAYLLATGISLVGIIILIDYNIRKSKNRRVTNV